ncbi:thiamine/thiamine pyrophosphate ABC transporter permease ThiP [Tabrizicola sp. J26]|uniref:thiamine/thiamine pyrophosphate ABC transporter permease ThiP n=1 Tax=Alitabrizicola rongguiensis TaxID=2909234 RepID=UPI001F413942|nr:thiamine/thiamine pyrophosphate ABC transporter permease ThiP [Tabrizicola rongguiensis]MCF1708330.1 thiamine/thiamine pyrophosphate ABC transporter permease ThiP [Tabrizicola rongguiensis]
MARRAGPVTRAGRAVALGVAALTLGTLLAVLLRAETASFGPADWSALRFTVLAALTAATLSVGLAVPASRALTRRRFPGRGLVITLMGAPFLLPVVVAVLGLLAVFGRSGLINRTFEVLGLSPVSIYGPHGVILGLVFFNFPLAVRMVLSGWQAIPAERLRLAAALGFGPDAVFRHLELPMLRQTLPGAFVAIFLVCLTSFAIPLTLGGGPRATTLELGIYQALRFDYDLGRAALLAAAQFALCAVAVGLAARLALPTRFGAGLDRQVERWDTRGWVLRLQDSVVLMLSCGFLMLPLAMIALRGVEGLPEMPASVWPAALRSVLVALVSTALCMAATVTLCAAISAGPAARWIETAGMLPLAASSLVLGTGLFILVHPFASPERLALPVTALVNAAMAMPYALRLILPAHREVEAAFGRLSDSLALTGLARLRWLILPRLRPVIGFASGVVAALSMGDLGVIALFANESQATLPLVVQQLMGAYRMPAAAGASLLLVGLSFALFWICDRGGRRHAAS